MRLRFYLDQPAGRPHIYRHGVTEVPDPEPDSLFVITAYTLQGKALTAYKRRRARKPRRT